MQVSCPAIIFVPNKVIIAIAFSNDQKVEEKIPHVALATNDMKKRIEIARFVKSACNKGGPFASVFGQLERGKEIEAEKRF